MSMPNVRIVVQGAPRADREFDVVETSKREAERLGQVLQKDASAALAELKRALAGGAGSGRR